MLVAGSLAAIFLYLALRQIVWKEILQTIHQVRIEYLVFGFFTNTIALMLRSLRWRTLVSARKKVGVMTMFWVTSIGYLGNTFLPARAGELLRSFTLGQIAGISSSYVLATALTERIMDVIALVLTGSLLIAAISNSVPGWLITTIHWMTIFGIIALVIFLLAPRFEGLIHKVISRIQFPGDWNSKFSHFVTQFLLGTQAFIHPGRAVAFIILAGLTWCMDGIGTMIFARGLNLTLSFGQALLFLAALGLASALPSTPGYIGIYQFVAVTVMPAFNISPSQALTYIIAGQAVYIITDVTWGFIGLWKLGINPKTILSGGWRQFNSNNDKSGT
jgi:uncharacterized protein (TIRG00374 family)